MPSHRRALGLQPSLGQCRLRRATQGHGLFWGQPLPRERSVREQKDPPALCKRRTTLEGWPAPELPEGPLRPGSDIITGSLTTTPPCRLLGPPEPTP